MNRLTPFTALLVFVIAALGFSLSYEALYQYAYANGITGHLVWAWPLVIDGFMLVISLSILRASLNQESVWPLWAMAIVAIVISTYFNIAHAPDTFAGRAVATVPPLAMFFAFETFIRQIRKTVERKALQASLQVLHTEERDAQDRTQKLQGQFEKTQVALKEKKDELKETQAAIKKAQQELADAQAGDTKTKLAMYYLQNPDATQAAAAQALGVSHTRVGQLLKAARQVNPAPNGSGKE